MARRSSSATTKEARQVDYAGQIRREALASGAKSIRLCTQACGELAKILKEQNLGGICRSLSIAWLSDRSRGASLVDRMMGLGGSVKTDVVLPMCLAYKAKGNMNRLEEQSYIVTELQKAALSHCGTETGKAATVGAGVGVWYFWLKNGDLAGLGQLRMLNIRDGYDHAMAVDLRDSSCPIFFDPNWGEFFFPSTAHLGNFLLTSMFVPEGAETLYANQIAFATVEKMGFQ